MKQKFYLYQYSSGDIFLSQKETNVALPIFGTIELDVQPIKKEVEKVVSMTVDGEVFGGEKMVSAMWVPEDAYDVKVVYKIKE